ncbi:MAG: hypothetical protein A3J10_01910 [Candidatus Sungbacteria bacterium RIFCSPLOWO2_02_FULL_54_10]|uniref:Uncharacterized protein n=1 Tax=Candidatus Sungbacteria bacterium RIFCSPHIGHO2_02_FULL_53_17 TaxID=1802275 RepID=A0A1G2KXN0_9BACT|nr:MAG: hypothetical protein A3C92_03370 [Candidatus Sungbacteria bacterium RIFCSPHIGHO2_02_FULL_53_17]OHA12805.1 MAG: hypothetical protein A3J10_01910 [Candidatus Sungbacteria bacterium RIFCSPLOWO2_02_FULL_54_10]
MGVTDPPTENFVNQIQRDLAYRLDALQSICEQYGAQSEMCQQSIQLWELQHAANVRSAHISFYIHRIGTIISLLIGLIILGFILWKYCKGCISTRTHN